jgi:hypothetical protein
VGKDSIRSPTGLASRDPASIVYDDALVERLYNREGSRPRSGQSDLFRLVFDEDNAETRAWINAAIGLIQPSIAVPLTQKLRSESFHTALCELAVAEQLANTGFDVQYEPHLSGRTPDFYLPKTGSHRALIVEVWSRQPKAGTSKRRRGWQHLSQRIGEIPSRSVWGLRNAQ